MSKLSPTKTPDLKRPTNQELITFVDDLEQIFADIVDDPCQIEFKALRSILELRIPRKLVAGRCPNCKELTTPYERRQIFYCSCCQQMITTGNAKQQKPKTKQKKL